MTDASSRSTSRVDRAAEGARAEAQAARFLAARGLTIVARNFRTRHGEIDLIARDGATLVFIEVRRRASSRFGGAAASITAAKQARWTLAARAYLARFPEPAGMPLRRRPARRTGAADHRLAARRHRGRVSERCRAAAKRTPLSEERRTAPCAGDKSAPVRIAAR